MKIYDKFILATKENAIATYHDEKTASIQEKL
jgi:hypothetical protein